MSNLLFNIRFGCYHYQIDKQYKFTKTYNPHHEGNKRRFEVYCVFGIHFN